MTDGRLIIILQAFNLILMALCTVLILKRLNFFTRLLMRQSIDTADERKAETKATAEKLAVVQVATAEKLAVDQVVLAETVSQKLDAAATIVSDAALGAAAEIKVAVEKAAVTAAQGLAGEINQLRSEIQASSTPPGTVDAAVIDLVKHPDDKHGGKVDAAVIDLLKSKEKK